MSMFLNIDDEYYPEILRFADREGRILEGAVKDYLSVMKDIKRMAIKSGDLSLALEGFNLMAGRISDEIYKITDAAVKVLTGYMESVEEADSFLFE